MDVEEYVGIHKRKNMGRVFPTEGTAYVRLRSESNYYTLRKWGDVQRLEGKLQRGHKPDATDLRCHAQRFGFCPVGHKESWEVFSDRTGWGETRGREAS